MTDTVVGSLQIDADNIIKIRIAHTQQQIILCNTGIVYHDIQMSVFLYDFLQHGLYLLSIGDIALYHFVMTFRITLCQNRTGSLFTVCIIDDHVVFL